MRQHSTTNTKNLFNIGIFVFIIIVFVAFNYSFRTPLLVGFAMAVLTYPLYSLVQTQISKKIKFKTKGLSAVIVVVITTIILAFILDITASQLAKEIPKLALSAYNSIQNLPNNQNLLDIISRFGLSKGDLEDFLKQINSAFNTNQGLDLNASQNFFTKENIYQILGFGRQIFSIVFDQVTNLIIFFLAWINALMFGNQWLQAILSLLPFKENEVSVIKKDLQLGIRNVIYANLLSGLIHAAVCFVIMSIFGVPNIFIISVIVFLIGFLPASPSELGYAIPIGIIFASNPLAGVILAIIAEAIILWVNYVFLPKIILSGSEGNPLFVVTGVLTGIMFFGLMGFVIGPVIMIFVNTLGQILLKRNQGNNTPIDTVSIS